jgi:hypothetical protein
MTDSQFSVPLDADLTADYLEELAEPTQGLMQALANFLRALPRARRRSDSRARSSLSFQQVPYISRLTSEDTDRFARELDEAWQSSDGDANDS